MDFGGLLKGNNIIFLLFFLLLFNGKTPFDFKENNLFFILIIFLVVFNDGFLGGFGN